MEIQFDPISTALLQNHRAVAKAMVVLFSLQTSTEQHTKTTRESNGVGFNSHDARKCSYYARWVLNLDENDSTEAVQTRIRNYLTHGHNPGFNRDLTGNYLKDARMRSLKYVGQLKRYADSKKAVAAATVAVEASNAANDS